MDPPVLLRVRSKCPEHAKKGHGRTGKGQDRTGLDRTAKGQERTEQPGDKKGHGKTGEDRTCLHACLLVCLPTCLHA